MPPKKKARQAPSIKQDFLASLSRDLDSNSSHTDVTPEQLLRAFGLAGPRAGAPDDEHLHRSCVNRWAEGGVEVVEEEAAPEVVVLSSSEDELELAPQKSAKGKGKGKAKGKEVCSAENCGKNPRCPNWLGQEKWEDAGELVAGTRREVWGRGQALSFRDFHSQGYASVSEGGWHRRRPFERARGGPSCRVEGGLSWLGYVRSGADPTLQNLGATCYVNSFLQASLGFAMEELCS